MKAKIDNTQQNRKCILCAERDCKRMQQTDTEGVQAKAQLGGKGDPQGILQETEFWLYYQMVFVPIRIQPKE